MVMAKQMKKIILIGIFGLLLVAGCSSPQTVDRKNETDSLGLPVIAESPTSAQPDEIPQEPTLDILSEPTQITLEADSTPSITDVSPESPEETQPSQPVVKTGLEATDPSTVQLASGKPQLVEFFAFW
jgi:hypothetical protein